jgi:hypothetical protein
MQSKVGIGVFDPTVTQGALITWLFNFDLIPDGRGFSLQNLQHIVVRMQIKPQTETFQTEQYLIFRRVLVSEGISFQPFFLRTSRYDVIFGTRCVYIPKIPYNGRIPLENIYQLVYLGL